MGIATNRIKIPKGNTFSFDITVTDYVGDAFNLTGYTATTLIKSGDTTLTTVTTVCDDDPTTGIQNITIDSTDTEIIVATTYMLFCTIKNTASPDLEYTIVRSKLKITESGL